MSLLISNGRLLDPSSATDKLADIRITDGLISEIGPAGSLSAGDNDEVIDATGRWVSPGFIDLGARLREPGQEYKEDLESGGNSAVAGGFTTVVVMPDTHPVVDNAEHVQYILARSNALGLCQFLPTGALTVGRQGQILAPLAEMQKAGAVAFTDAGRPVSNSQLMRNALEYAQGFGLTILSHAEDIELSCQGHVNEGPVSTRLGLKGLPVVAEETIVARDAMLAEFTGARLHFSHLTTGRSVHKLAQAQQAGAAVTGAAAAHHLVLTDEDVNGFDTSAKINPPLRSNSDRLALIEGIRAGVLSAITSHHTPQSSLEKDTTFDRAEFGALGLQTTLPAALHLVDEHDLEPLTVLGCLTSGPAAILGMDIGKIAVGSTADLTIFDPNQTWEFTPEANLSKSSNSSFIGKTLKGRVLKTIAKGKVVFTI